MNIFKMKTIGVSVFAFLAVLFASAAVNGQGGEQRRPELPAGCEHLEAPAEERVAFKVFAEGVQIYSWSGTAWVPVGPLADLFADRGRNGKVGIHYGGPRWESNSGSMRPIRFLALSIQARSHGCCFQWWRPKVRASSTGLRTFSV
jgi:hypothetical protein